MTSITIDKSKVTDFGVYIVYVTTEIAQWTDNAVLSVNICYNADDLNELGFGEFNLNVGEIATIKNNPNIDYDGVYVTRIA